MRKAFIKITFLSMVAAFAATGIDAQITIKLPNIKKIVKPDVHVDNNTNVTDTSNTKNNSNQVTTHTNNNASSTDWWIDYQVGEIAKYRDRLTSWNPANQVFPRPSSSDDYIGLALSKIERSSWIADKKVAPNARLDAALDEVKALLYKRLPEYTINPRSFTNRNAAEEKLMMAGLSDITGMKVYKIGFNQANWIVETNELGIPKARYKHGLIYGRNPSSEDPFCRVWYINVVQPYAGGGTYAATEARYIEREFIACPAG